MTTKNFQNPTNEEITNYAYFLWESDGKVNGRDLDYWLQAEAHLTAALQHEAAISKPTPSPAPEVVGKKSQPETANSSAFPTKSPRLRQNRPGRGRAYV